MQHIMILIGLNSLQNNCIQAVMKLLEYIFYQIITTNKGVLLAPPHIIVEIHKHNLMATYVIISVPVTDCSNYTQHPLHSHRNHLHHLHNHRPPVMITYPSILYTCKCINTCNIHSRTEHITQLKNQWKTRIMAYLLIVFHTTSFMQLELWFMNIKSFIQKQTCWLRTWGYKTGYQLGVWVCVCFIAELLPTHVLTTQLIYMYTSIDSDSFASYTHIPVDSLVVHTHTCW